MHWTGWAINPWERGRTWETVNEILESTLQWAQRYSFANVPEFDIGQLVVSLP